MSVSAPIDLNGVINSAVIVLLFHNALLVVLLYVSCTMVFERSANTHLLHYSLQPILFGGEKRISGSKQDEVDLSYNAGGCSCLCPGGTE